MITDKDSDAISNPEELLSKMFRDIREIGYRHNPLRLIEESHDACINLIKQYEERIRAESADQARKEADEKLAIAVKALEEASIILSKTDGDYDALCAIRQALKEIQK